MRCLEGRDSRLPWRAQACAGAYLGACMGWYAALARQKKVSLSAWTCEGAKMQWRGLQVTRGRTDQVTRQVHP